MPLVKQSDGSFELTVPLSSEDKILYKYVVDGEWFVSKDQSIETDASGNENNVVSVSQLAVLSASTKIPEAGGLAIGSGTVNTTVLPSAEGQQATLGEPGIVIPKDAEALSAFETVRNVDPKTLNKPAELTPELTPEEKKKQKKKLKKTQYKLNKKKKKAAAAGGDEDSTTEAEPTPEPAAAAVADPEVVAPVVAAPVVATPVEVTEAPNAESVQKEVVAEVPAVEKAVVEEAPVAEGVPAASEETAAPAEESVVPEDVAEAETKEVDAAPVAKKFDIETDEIIIAHGGSSKEIEEQLRAANGGAPIEEIQPTESEALKLTQESKIHETTTAVEAAAKSAKNDVSEEAKVPAKAKKAEKKKGFFSKLKKLFK